MRRIHQRSPVHFRSVFQAHEDNIWQSFFDGNTKMCAFYYRDMSRFRRFPVRHFSDEILLHALITGWDLRMRDISVARKCEENDLSKICHHQQALDLSIIMDRPYINCDRVREHCCAYISGMVIPFQHRTLFQYLLAQYLVAL